MSDYNQNKDSDLINLHSISNEYGDHLIPSPPHEKLEPMPNSERMGIMDSLRGLALTGILMMNIEWFNRPTSELGRFDPSINGADYAASWFVKAFIEGKFYKLFALLFGMGFAVMLIKAQQAERPFVSLFLRRMSALFIFGMAHYIFLWDGDILHDYAFAGLLLLGWVQLVKTERFSRFAKPISLMKFGLSILVLPAVAMIIVGIYLGMTKDNIELKEKWSERIEIVALTNSLLAEKEINASITMDEDTLSVDDKMAQITELAANQEIETQYALSDDVIEEDNDDKDVDLMTREERIKYIANKRVKNKLERIDNGETETKAVTDPSYWSGVLYRISTLPDALAGTLIFSLVMLVPIFLIGYWLVASGIINNSEKHPYLFKSLAWVGSVTGLGITVASLIIIQSPITQDTFYIRNTAEILFGFSQYIVAAGYLGIMVCLYQSNWWRSKLDFFAPLGRMALTNYIMHSVILSLIFYGFAGNMFGQILRAEQMLIVVAIISFQLILSSWWLNRFRFGPLEWVWRCLTYKKFQPMKL